MSCGLAQPCLPLEYQSERLHLQYAWTDKHSQVTANVNCFALSYNLLTKELLLPRNGLLLSLNRSAGSGAQLLDCFIMFALHHDML